MKKCPYCAEEVQEEAIRCKHCGVNFGTAQKTDNNNKILICSCICIGIILVILTIGYSVVKNNIVSYAKEKYGYTDDGYKFSLISYNFNNAKIKVSTSDGKYTFVRHFLKNPNGQWSDNNYTYDKELSNKMDAAFESLKINILSKRILYDPVGNNEVKQHFKKLVEEEKAINPKRGIIYDNILKTIN